MIEKIAEPLNREMIKRELTPSKFLRMTNARGNAIYEIDAYDSPCVMLELGRLRELTFRMAGGGTGNAMDIDEYDTADPPFKQLIVWKDETEEIISAYRYILGKNVKLDENGYPHTPTSKLFCFSQEFIKEKWPHCIELGRSFVQPAYQAANNKRESLFALDNIWDALGALIVNYPEIEYFIGKMTLYNTYNRKARRLILDFLKTHFQGDEKWIRPLHTSDNIPTGETTPVKNYLSEEDFKEDFKQLNSAIRELGESIPPLIKTYLSLSPSIQCFGISENEEFGPVEEICILIKISDIYERKKSRHVDSYRKSGNPSV
jgi:hypothetical protein